MPLENAFAIIMAGGKGERFWPHSRTRNPKPLLRLVGDLTLIEQTVERIQNILPPANIVIVTNNDFVEPMRSLLPSIPSQNFIGEPIGKDTAPCIVLGAVMAKTLSRSKNPVLIALPADHAIKNSVLFAKTIESCIPFAEKGKIATIGVTPHYPSSGYGYIKCGRPLPSPKTDFKINEVETFREKPDFETAKKLFEDKSWKWNCGVFIMSHDTLCDTLSKYSPELYHLHQKLLKAASENSLTQSLPNVYPEVNKISIDFAIMEKAFGNMVVATFDSDWDDVGSWTALRSQIRPDKSNNVIRGTHVGIDTQNCIIVGEQNHLIATLDIDDLIIVNTGDATLVCNAKSAQRIKDIVKEIASHPEYAKYL